MKLIIFFFVILLFGLFIGQDVYTFHSVMSSNYETPWFSNSWVKEPYTMFRLVNSESKEYWTKNAAGDDWLVRDVYYKNKIFWTILEKRIALTGENNERRY